MDIKFIEPVRLCNSWYNFRARVFPLVRGIINNASDIINTKFGFKYPLTHVTHFHFYRAELGARSDTHSKTARTLHASFSRDSNRITAMASDGSDDSATMTQDVTSVTMKTCLYRAKVYLSEACK